jgi:hypothetical protein
VSAKLPEELRLALGEIAGIRAQLSPLIEKPQGYDADDIERAAACAMLHSFYTQIEKALTLIAREWDGKMPTSEFWHRDLLKQMATVTERRPAVIPEFLLPALGEFLAFRHLFRGASIVLMRWNKLVPLLEKVDGTHLAVAECLEDFVASLERRS